MTDIVLQPHPASRRAPESDPDPIVGGRVELQLLTTLKCNLKCTYCSLGVGDALGSQNHVEYDLPDFFGPLILGERPPVRWFINKIS